MSKVQPRLWGGDGKEGSMTQDEQDAFQLGFWIGAIVCGVVCLIMVLVAGCKP